MSFLGRLVIYFVLFLVSVLVMKRPLGSELENWLNGAFSAIIAVEIAFYELRAQRGQKQKDDEKARKEKETDVYVRHQEKATLAIYSLLVLMNNFANIMEEGRRIGAISEDSEKKKELVFSQMSNRVESYFKDFKDLAKQVENQLLYFSDLNNLTELNSKVSEINFELRELSEYLRPEYLVGGLKFTQLKKEKIVQLMVQLQEKLCESDALSDSNRNKCSSLCNELENYNNLVTLTKEVIRSLFDTEVQITVRDVQNKVKRSEYKLAFNKVDVTQEFEKYNENNQKDANVARTMMKIWALEHDTSKPEYEYTKSKGPYSKIYLSKIIR